MIILNKVDSDRLVGGFGAAGGGLIGLAIFFYFVAYQLQPFLKHSGLVEMLVIMGIIFLIPAIVIGLKSKKP